MIPAELREEIREIATRDYSGRQEDAFPCWALSCILADQELGHEVLRESVAVGNGDLGIDGYWVDESNRRIILLQSKHSGRVSREDATSFRASIQALINEDYVRDRGNAVLKEIYPELLEALLDDSYTIQAFLACGGTVRRGTRSYADAEGSQDWQFQFDNAAHTKELRLRVLALSELASLRNQLVASVNVVEPEVVMPIPIINNYPSLHHMGGDFPAVQVTVPAKVLIDAYEVYRAEIFRYNPRGPLGSNKVNKEIERTLKDPVLKRHFHLLNNGITAICDSVNYWEARQELEVKNFQVVNGCQTVYTLHQLRVHISDEVKVSVRIVEGLQATWGVGEISKACQTGRGGNFEGFQLPNRCQA